MSDRAIERSQTLGGGLTQSDPDGPWVRFSDHEAEVKRLESERDDAEAKAFDHHCMVGEIHTELEEARSRAQQAEAKYRELASKLESGYSFCHPEDDCEGQRVWLREANRAEEAEAKLATLVKANQKAITKLQGPARNQEPDAVAVHLQRALRNLDSSPATEETND